MGQVEIPALYLWIYRDLLEKFKCQAILPEYAFEQMNRRVFRIPKVLFWNILHEMEGFDLIKKVSHKQIIILPNKQVKRLDQLNSSVLW